MAETPICAGDANPTCNPGTQQTGTWQPEPCPCSPELGTAAAYFELRAVAASSFERGATAASSKLDASTASFERAATAASFRLSATAAFSELGGADCLIECHCNRRCTHRCDRR